MKGALCQAETDGMQKIQNLHNWISELPEELAREVRCCFTTRKLISGEYLYRQGDAPAACFQVASGRLKVCKSNVNGQELVRTLAMKAYAAFATSADRGGFREI